MKTKSHLIRTSLVLGIVHSAWAQPVITSQPTVQLMTVDATAAFAVTATGTAPLAYQWRFNNTNLADKINRSLVLANVQLTNAGNYSVVVTNAFGSVTSRVAGAALEVTIQCGW